MLRWTIAVVLLLLVGCASVNVENTNAPKTQAEVERLARIKFPPSASQIQTYGVVGMDNVHLIRFEMAAQDLPTFLQQSGLPQLEDDYRPGNIDTYPASEPAWWDAKQAQRVAGTSDRPDGVYREIMVDTSQAETLVVYVFAGA